ncbi:MAG TPA: RHS repeat-associated core domain-containing protein [Bacteroidia bacterium]
MAAGTGGKIYYYKAGTGYVSQHGFTGYAGTEVFRDIYFHDDRVGYVVGDAGMALKCSMVTNAGETGSELLTADQPIWQPLCASAIYLGRTSGTVNFNALSFTTRAGGFLAGSYASAGNHQHALLLDDESDLYSTRLWYDKLGRMVVSQNTKQYNQSPKAFGYTKYDALGRIKEVGEKSENSTNTTFRKIFGADVSGLFNSNTINDDSLTSWLAGNGVKKEVTRTYYDTVMFISLPIVQENLRKRVSGVTYEDIDDNIDSTYQYGSFYTYDIHGSVKSLVQDNPEMFVSSQRYKRIDYDFDLISGKVNKVTYQPNAPDMFIHKYTYDGDNRMTKVETSTDDIIFKTDVKYYFYAHGALARAEYGENQVQGMDYAYTLQGWIKGVNSNTLKSSRDMGQDDFNDSTNANASFSEDAFGYTLGYYEGDYKAISGLKWSSVSNRFEAETEGAEFKTETYDLFNGNISHMVSSIVQTDTTSGGFADIQTAKPLATSYKYDQLNRLKKSISFNNIDIPNNLWEASGQTVNNMYENTFTFDANGNILTQNRFDDAGVKFENMDYRYKRDANGNIIHNRLYHVNDSASSGLQIDDIDDQGAFVSTNVSMNTVNNFRYDEIGNLVADSTEQIDTIKWTVYGKIKEIKRKSGSSKKNLKFDYDHSGNRVAKHILSSSNNWEKTTYYVRDPQGNIMSVYDEAIVDSAFSFKLKELHLYGNSRIGMYMPEMEMIGADTTFELTFDTLNKRVYELSNHIGNIMLVVTDRQIGVDTNSDGFIDIRQADIASTSDYAAYGTKLYNRGFESSEYKFSFNGKMDDLETVETRGGTQDYGMRIYNPSLGKFLSVDPITAKYPELTPYQFASNRPIDGIDEDGLEYTKPDGSGTGPVTPEEAQKVGATPDGPTAPKPAEKTDVERLQMQVANYQKLHPDFKPPVPTNPGTISTPALTSQEQMGLQFGIGVADGLMWYAPEIGLAKALPVISKISQATKTFEGVALPNFTLGKTVYKYTPSGKSFVPFNSSGLGFTTDLVTKSSVDAFTGLGLGFQITTGAGKGAINSMSSSYTVYQTTMRGFYLSGKVASQGPTLGGATQFVAFRGATIFTNSTKVAKTTLGPAPKIGFGF